MYLFFKTIFLIFIFTLFYSILQYCIGFVIHWHESAMGVHEFPILNLPPTSHPISSLWIIPMHQPQASCIEHRLAIRFLHDNIYVSMPFSQIIPPSPSPTGSKSPFYTSVSLLLSHIEGYHYHLSKFHIYNSFKFLFTIQILCLFLFGYRTFPSLLSGNLLSLFSYIIP